MYRQDKADRIAEIVSLASDTQGQSTPADSDHISYTGFSAFIQALFDDALPDELDIYDSSQLFHAALSFWRFSACRAPNDVLLRVFNPNMAEHGWESPHTILEIVAADMPFLVDSILGELTAQGVELRSVLHPITNVERDAAGRCLDFASGVEDLSNGAHRESVIHIEFNYHSDERRLTSLQNRLNTIVNEVRIVIADYEPMLDRLNEAIEGLQDMSGTIDPEEAAECQAFLSWLRDDHFALLGSRVYRFEGEPETGTLEPLDETGLGILRDPSARMLRRGDKLVYFTSEVREFLMLPSPIIITKANVRSEVHRRVYMDYIGVKLFDAQGTLTGEYRFIGLFTSEAYNRSISRIPLLSRKVERVIERAGFMSLSFNKKALTNILETYPRDELFQTSEDELLRISLGILDLHERPRTRLFVRRDRYDRYVSALVYIPRDRYDSRTRHQVAETLVNAYQGRLSAFYPQFNDTPLARIHFIIGRNSEEAFDYPDPDDVEKTIVAVTQNFRDALARELNEIYGEENSRPLVARYGDAFSAGYREINTAKDACYDIEKLEPLSAPPAIALRCYQRAGDPAHSLRLKLYRASETIPLSDVLPILENMGLKVITEAGNPVHRADGTFWVHDFYMEQPSELELVFGQVAENLEEAFEAIWHGHAANDPFNRLCVEQGISWRYVALLRGFAHYWRQTGRTLSIAYMQETLANHPIVTKLLVTAFALKFDPALALSKQDREQQFEDHRAQIISALDDVRSLDEDRIIRQFLALISALWRTNFYQVNQAGETKSYISFKISSRDLEDLPLPKPLTEIFVYSPRVEGVHLRWGFVARGGLRWSDRREDFRTEILGLAKAQQVKNAVIVPVGAKGGFVPQNLPEGGSREDIQQEGIVCYRIFISGLLDLADNIVDGDVVKPDGVVVHDGNDPYLVVAADKGTATFSDIANDISHAYGFWLGDAFASGGSQGYDHKGMGITARGAWEAVKRHFREMGTDIQTQPFTAVGVGDMSGDVFGNGMLLSEQTRLIAAFDHRDIFIDPNPDAAVSFAERKRLFSLPRSSWESYDQNLISDGGGVYSRSLKAIDLSPEAKEVLNITGDKLTPDDVMQAILRAPADLLWFGGIGTYIKAASQRHSEAGDKANDSLRINADEVNVKVIGEGANLGVTQAGRIAFAQKGGRINTDAVDNAAGVDCSDHEVNIKILVDRVLSEGHLSTDERNVLLSDMTDEVADLVLANNYAQTLALSLSEHTAPARLDAHQRFMHALESKGRLDRDVEGLPSDDQINDLSLENRGLTRPELAVVMAYAKIALFDALIESDVPDEPYLTQALFDYLPQRLVAHYRETAEQHQLRREIIATVLGGDIINMGGMSFVHRLVENSGADAALVARTFIAAKESFGLSDLWQEVHQLDNRIESDVQLSLYGAIRQFLMQRTLWFLRYRVADGDGVALPLEETIQAYQTGINDVASTMPDCLAPQMLLHMNTVQDTYLHAGVPEDLARAISMLEPMSAACDIIDVLKSMDVDMALASALYFRIGDYLGIDGLREQATQLHLSEHWERLAVRRTIDDLNQQQRQLLQIVLADMTADDNAETILQAWLGRHQAAAERTKVMIAEMESGGALSVAKLSLAASQVRELATMAGARLSV